MVGPLSVVIIIINILSLVCFCVSLLAATSEVKPDFRVVPATAVVVVAIASVTART